MDKPKGGRGHRAPYQTTHLRVPAPLKDSLQSQIDQWRAAYQPGEPSPPAPTPTLSPDHIAMAQEILRAALTLKPNAGGKIKTEIRRALELLGARIEKS